MKIIRHKKFRKSYKKLTVSQQKKVDKAIAKFIKNPSDSTLKNHSLKGNLNNVRAISAGWDLRIIFQEFDDYIVVVFLQVGSHSQVY